MEKKEEDALANELEEIFNVKMLHVSNVVPASAIHVFLCGDLCREILSYLPASELFSFGKVSSEFHRQALSLSRKNSHRLLVTSGLFNGAFVKGVKSPKGWAIGCGNGIAAAVEFAIYRKASMGKFCNSKSYFEHLRTIVYNLRLNKDLCKRVESGEVLPETLAIMSSEEMQSVEVRRERKRLREKAIEESRKPKALPDIVGSFQCPNCSSDRQWIRRHTLSGMVDRYSETLVCVDCYTHVSATSNRIEHRSKQ